MGVEEGKKEGTEKMSILINPCHPDGSIYQTVNTNDLQDRRVPHAQPKAEVHASLAARPRE